MDIAQIIPYQTIRDLLRIQNITHLHSIQVEAVEKGLFFYQNFLVCTPSGSGKTLIAELAIAKNLMNTSSKILYLLPYKALAAEKEVHFKKIFSPPYTLIKFNVKSITSDSDEDEKNIDDTDLVITTFEKCDSLMRHGSPYIAKVRLIIIDEIHEIGSGSRGSRLEILLTRLLSFYPNIQFIALSATIANINQFNEWLNTFGKKFTLIHAEKRPIQLNYDLRIYRNKLSEIGKLITNGLAEKLQILIFVNRRKDCINFVKFFQKKVQKYLDEFDKDELKKGYDLLSSQKSIATSLKEVILDGIAYHNASLSLFDRKTIEKLFQKRHLKVLIATSTLAAGVNTPAGMVIISDIVQHRRIYQITEADYEKEEYICNLKSTGVFKPINSNQLHQMLGRAGRLGYDESGKAIVLCRHQEEVDFVRNFYFQECCPAQSLIPKYASLISQINNIDRLHEIVLLFICENEFTSLESIEIFLKKTFFNFCYKHENGSLLDFFSIIDLNMSYFLNQYGDKNYILIPNSAHLFQIKSTSISGSIEWMKNDLLKEQFHCNIDLKIGMTCSCNPQKKYFNPNQSDCKSISICSHLTYFIQFLLDHEDTNVQKITKNIIAILVNHNAVIHYLEENEFIAQYPNSNLYSPSQLGILTNSLYITPSKIVKIKEILKYHQFEKPDNILGLLINTYSMDHEFNYQKTFQIGIDWINEKVVSQILADNPKFGIGDLFNLKNDLYREASIFEAVANHFIILTHNEEIDLSIPDKLHTLGLRIKHGVKPDLLDLVENLPNISRNKARILYQAGIKSEIEFRSENMVEIARKSKLKLSAINEILGKPSQNTSQLSLLDYMLS